jgi:Na+-driven multidrug efflux pump
VICRVILSVLLGIVMDMGVIGITIAMIADWAIHAVLIVWRYRSGKWKNFEVI